MKIEGFDKLTSIGTENADALVKSGTAAMKGFEEMAKAAQALATKSAETTDAAFKAMLACKSPVELADLQVRIARESLEIAIAESRRFAELGSTTFTAALEPLNARFAALQDMVKSAA